MSSLIVLMLLGAPKVEPNHAFFVAHVEAARRNMNVAERIHVEPFIGEIRIQIPGERKPQKRIAYAQALGHEFLVVYDPGWLADASEREARWVAYHEVCHVALQGDQLRNGLVLGESRETPEKAVRKLEAQASNCADKWDEQLERGKHKGRSALALALAILF